MKQRTPTDTIEFVVCGRFDATDTDRLKPDPATHDMITAIKQEIRRRELNPYGKVSVCNCGQAEENGLSVTVLPEQVRYCEVDPGRADTMVERHLESVVREPS